MVKHFNFSKEIKAYSGRHRPTNGFVKSLLSVLIVLLASSANSHAQERAARGVGGLSGGNVNTATSAIASQVQLDLAQFEARIQELEGEVEELEEENAQLRDDLGRLNQREATATTNLQTTDQKLQKRLADLERRLNQLSQSSVSRADLEAFADELKRLMVVDVKVLNPRQTGGAAKRDWRASDCPAGFRRSSIIKGPGYAGPESARDYVLCVKYLR